METLNLQQAADYLHMCPEEVRRRAKTGRLPGAKPGKRWVFIRADLEQWLRCNYSTQRKTAQPKEKKRWESSNVKKHGGMISQHQLEEEYANLLGLETGSAHKNSTIS